MDAKYMLEEHILKQTLHNNPTTNNFQNCWCGDKCIFKEIQDYPRDSFYQEPHDIFYL